MEKPQIQELWPPLKTARCEDGRRSGRRGLTMNWRDGGIHLTQISSLFVKFFLSLKKKKNSYSIRAYPHPLPRIFYPAFYPDVSGFIQSSGHSQTLDRITNYPIQTQIRTTKRSLKVFPRRQVPAESLSPVGYMFKQYESFCF